MNPHERRKAQPIYTGVLAYFPDALLAVAECSRVGNEQHQPGEPMRWDRSKSKDEADALVRHLLDHGRTDTDGVKHSAKLAWRALALLQREIERERDLEAIVAFENHPAQVVPTSLGVRVTARSGDSAKDGDFVVAPEPTGYTKVAYQDLENYKGSRRWPEGEALRESYHRQPDDFSSERVPSPDRPGYSRR